MKMLGAIQAVLFDAEQKRSHNQRIEAWLGMLKDVLYDAEDMVDEFECEALRRNVVKSALKSDFGLTEQIFDRHIIHTEREMTHSFIHASNVNGREQAGDDVIETLLQSVDGENVSIIPIVGIGGIGKTTLAKLVYNDQRV
ncbi:hypothetical protein GH714_032827 [Hevea brasiliensis]|uniref:Rx N-terminal domain-containing protein n=1 Tax=Hevea brasiliensis TaxID=3981 RepID=A0A6A6M6I6_HEVBR|nr:hypothetical protein GH714_032827 [Hevea brasiliensis]